MKVLFDLAPSGNEYGFCGIAQDSRLLFSAFTESKIVETHGLLRSNHTLHANEIAFIQAILENKIDYKTSHPLLLKAFRLLTLTARRYSKIYKINSNQLNHTILEKYFSTLSSSAKERLLKLHYYFSLLPTNKILFNLKMGMKKPFLQTAGFNFLITQDTRSVIATDPRTIKIARYHDGIPIFFSDTSNTPPKTYFLTIKATESDTIFVCNSDNSLRELSKISPRAAEQAKVIPCLVAEMKAVSTPLEILKKIAELRVSSSTLPRDEKKAALSLREWFNPTSTSAGIPRYVMILATLEPRKNHISLINSWMKLRHQLKQNIKLMVVGSPGWDYETILSIMRPSVEAGDLLHLEKVTQDELPYLYSAAACFVFPSFGEGFGLPPIEAMQCGCPVIVSDIPAHRYSAGNAAIYCNPYDEEDIAQKIQSILFPESQLQIAELIHKGYENIQRFSVSSILPQWEALLTQLNIQKNYGVMT